mmetsp:Transcript_6820/g.15566  ORF Transcript_6820/g.15566 Transcript_6820/m.15566 type:complete len:231 (+) Transcript_6820:349-1041(+)
MSAMSFENKIAFSSKMSKRSFSESWAARGFGAFLSEALLLVAVSLAGDRESVVVELDTSPRGTFRTTLGGPPILNDELGALLGVAGTASESDRTEAVSAGDSHLDLEGVRSWLRLDVLPALGVEAEKESDLCALPPREAGACLSSAMEAGHSGQARSWRSRAARANFWPQYLHSTGLSLHCLEWPSSRISQHHSQRSSSGSASGSFTRLLWEDLATWASLGEGPQRPSLS